MCLSVLTRSVHHVPQCFNTFYPTCLSALTLCVQMCLSVLRRPIQHVPQCFNTFYLTHASLFYSRFILWIRVIYHLSREISCLLRYVEDYFMYSLFRYTHRNRMYCLLKYIQGYCVYSLLWYVQKHCAYSFILKVYFFGCIAIWVKNKCNGPFHHTSIWVHVPRITSFFLWLILLVFYCHKQHQQRSD